MGDPTKDEMLTFLMAETCGELDVFDAEEAIYWFAASYHGGQWTNLYSALSTSPFHPGPIANGPEEGSGAEYLYSCLESEYAVGRK